MSPINCLWEVLYAWLTLFFYRAIKSNLKWSSAEIFWCDLVSKKPGWDNIGNHKADAVPESSQHKAPFQGCCFTACNLTPSLIKYHASALVLFFSQPLLCSILPPQTSVGPQIFCCCACLFLDLLLILRVLKCWMNGPDLQLIIKPSADG